MSSNPNKICPFCCKKLSFEPVKWAKEYTCNKHKYWLDIYDTHTTEIMYLFEYYLYMDYYDNTQEISIYINGKKIFSSEDIKLVMNYDDPDFENNLSKKIKTILTSQ